MAKKRRLYGQDQAEVVHLRIIASLVEQLGGQAFIPDSVLARTDLVLHTHHDETAAVAGWRLSVTPAAAEDTDGDSPG